LLAHIDYIIIFLYACILIILAMYFRKHASKSIENYFLGGKKIPWWALGISGMTSFFDMAGTMLIVSFLFMLGPRGIYIEFRGGAVLVLAFMMVVSGKWHYRSRCMTGAEWMEYRFGTTWGAQFARVLSAVGLIITSIGMLAYLIKALGLFVAMFTPISPSTASLLMLAVATLYTVASGFYGIVYTDIFKSIIILSAVLFISILAFTSISSTGELAALSMSVTGNPQWLNSSPQLHTTMPMGYEQYSNLIFVALFYLLRNTFIGMSSAGADPRYFGARSERECGKLTFLWTAMIALRWPLMIGFAMLGLHLVAGLFPDQSSLADAAALIKLHLPAVTKDQWSDVISRIANSPEQFNPHLIAGLQSIFSHDWKNTLYLLSYEGTVNPESIVPAVILFMIPPGFRGLLIVALIAGAFSTYDTTVNTAASNFIRDIYQRHIRPHAANRELIIVSYLTIVILTLAGFVFAYRMGSMNQIWGWVIMGLGGGIAIPSLLKFYWWRFNGSGFAIGTTVGIAAAIMQAFMFPGLHEWQQFVLVSCIALTATYIGTMLTPPTDAKVMAKFYTTTRPFGWWQPCRTLLEPAAYDQMTKEHRNDIAALPFALLWQVSLFLMPMQLMIRTYDSLMVTGCCFLVGSIGLYWFWYKNLPPDPAPADDQ
jgi:solute:Na+ symporter, SSS family